MSRARSAASAAWVAIHASAQPLWQGTSLAGDRHSAGRPHSTHGASGPVWPCRQSRNTPPGMVLVALDMPRSPVLFARDGADLAGRAGGLPSPGPALLCQVLAAWAGMWAKART